MDLKKDIGSFIILTENFLKKGILKEANVKTIGIFTRRMAIHDKQDTI